MHSIYSVDSGFLHFITLSLQTAGGIQAEFRTDTNHPPPPSFQKEGIIYAFLNDVGCLLKSLCNNKVGYLS